MNRKELLKSFIKRLHSGEPADNLKKEFRDAFAGLDATDIAKAEEELIREGMPVEEVRNLCEVHLAAFREALEQEGSLAPEGHPIHTLMTEHEMLLGYVDKMRNIVRGLKEKGGLASAGDELHFLQHLIQHLKESELHYLREENVLFPLLEKHGVTQPPKMMWMEHDEIRELKKDLFSIVDKAGQIAYKTFISKLDELSQALLEMLSSHFYKENNVLFPAAMRVISEAEWRDASIEFDEIGYCCFSPTTVKPQPKSEMPAVSVKAGVIEFGAGALSAAVIEAMLNSLPVDITFVDNEDTVRYFSQGKERIFTRSKAVIGRKVQNCHPEKSVHVVIRILDDFRSGTRDSADFWIDMEGRKIYIRYFPVRDAGGNYLGCLEVSQDITGIQIIEGQKRLLD